MCFLLEVPCVRTDRTRVTTAPAEPPRAQLGLSSMQANGSCLPEHKRDLAEMMVVLVFRSPLMFAILCGIIISFLLYVVTHIQQNF